MDQPVEQAWVAGDTPSLQGAVVLQVLPMLQTGGVERGTIEMVRAIRAAGGVPIVASAGGKLVSAVQHAGGRHETLRLNSKDPWEIWRNAGRLARLIRKERVAIVHARSRAPAWSAYWAARRTGARFVTTYHGIYSENLPFKRLYNRIMARGERVIAGSQFVADHITERHTFDPNALRVIPRGVDPEIFDPDAVGGVRIARLAEKWRLPLQRPVVMLPGRLTRWKGQIVLIEALARLGRPDVLAVLVGSDQGRTGYVDELLRLAKKLGVAEQLVLAGDCDDMPAALMLADIVVTPSVEPEAFGRTVVEAQAMARPVIATGHGGAAETVAHGVTGLLVPPGDAEVLAEAIAGVLDWPAEGRAIMGANARQAVRAQFSTAAMQAATIAVYRELLQGTA